MCEEGGTFLPPKGNPIRRAGTLQAGIFQAGIFQAGIFQAGTFQAGTPKAEGIHDEGQNLPTKSATIPL